MEDLEDPDEVLKAFANNSRTYLPMMDVSNVITLASLDLKLNEILETEDKAQLAALEKVIESMVG